MDLESWYYQDGTLLIHQMLMEMLLFLYIPPLMTPLDIMSFSDDEYLSFSFLCWTSFSIEYDTSSFLLVVHLKLQVGNIWGLSKTKSFLLGLDLSYDVNFLRRYAVILLFPKILDYALYMHDELTYIDVGID